MSSPPTITTIALIVAAGRGVRAGGGVPKQFRLIGGEPVLRRTLSNFLDDPVLDRVVVVIHPDDTAFYEQAVDGMNTRGRLLPVVHGGATRQASVHAGLEAIADLAPGAVVIHDAVRPFAPQQLNRHVLARLRDCEGAITALAVTDTLKRAASDNVTGNDPVIGETVDRTGLFAAQTPQAFRFPLLLDAHRRAAAAPEKSFTDDAGLIEWMGGRVALVAGDPRNVKLTTAEDFERARQHHQPERRSRFVTGIGYDVHQFTDGDHVILAGVRIPHDKGVLAHSDGDVVLHALTDALLGTIGDGDIGVHFPPSDPKWRGASSDRFLAEAARRIRARSGAIVNLDVTIVAEAPRVGPHREAMRIAISDAAGISPQAVSIKATTSEKLGFTGRGEGLAALAIATVALPDE